MCVEKHKEEVRINHSNQNRLLATSNGLLAMTKFPTTMTVQCACVQCMFKDCKTDAVYINVGGRSSGVVINDEVSIPKSSI